MLRRLIRRRLLVLAAALVALVVAVAALSAGKKQSTTSAGSPSLPTAAAGVSPGDGDVGSQIGSFIATDIDGHSVRVPSSGKPGVSGSLRSFRSQAGIT